VTTGGGSRPGLRRVLLLQAKTGSVAPAIERNAEVARQRDASSIARDSSACSRSNSDDSKRARP
jgi:hypothetical protein